MKIELEIKIVLDDETIVEHDIKLEDGSAQILRAMVDAGLLQCTQDVKAKLDEKLR